MLSLPDALMLRVAWRSHARRLGREHADARQIRALGFEQVARRVVQLLRRKQGDRPNQAVDLQAQQRGLVVAHAGGHHVEHVASGTVGLEAIEVSQQCRRQQRGAVEVGEGARAGLLAVPLETADTPKSGFVEILHRRIVSYKAGNVCSQ